MEKVAVLLKVPHADSLLIGFETCVLILFNLFTLKSPSRKQMWFYIIKVTYLELFSYKLTKNKGLTEGKKEL